MGGLFGGGASISNETQMLKGMRVQSSTFGAALPLVFGTTRISGNLIDYMDFTAIAHTTTQRSGGKGGGGVTSSNTSYTYTVAAAIGLGAGPVHGIGRVFSDKDVKTLSELNLSAYLGTLGQSPWPYMLSNHPERALNYPYLCYVAGVVDLGESGSLPNWSFEVYGQKLFGNGIIDANCYDIITTLLTDPTSGANYPSGYLGDNALYNAYCIANGLFISPAYNEQRQASDIITEIMQCSNSQPVVSQGKLYFKPYGIENVTGNGATYTPNLTPEYIIGDDDYIHRDNEDPVKLLKDDTVDRYNLQKVEFLNREDNYSPDIAPASDQASIEEIGLRPASPISLHCIAESVVAQFVAQTVLQRGLYYPNKYEFILPYFPFFLLDPMDLIAINDSHLGLVNTLVRIISCDPDSNKEITFVVEEVDIPSASAARYSLQTAGRTAMNYNIDPGNVNPPVIFEPPDMLSQNGLEVWIGASGGSLWGGCNVWVSEDGSTYKRVGRISNPARQGVLSAALPSGTDPDTTHSLAVNMALSRGELLSGTKQDADNYNTLCYVDGELISYQTAALTGVNQYSLSYLRRGVYGTTIKDHNPSSQFLRIDDAIFKYQFSSDKIGLPIYIKLTSFNIYGAGEQGLESVQPYTYNITGSALLSPLPNVQNIMSYYQNNRIWLKADRVSDFRQVVYEWRKGPTWNTATTLGRTSDPEFLTMGDGNYWVAACSISDKGIAYSANPTDILITGSNIPANVIATFDEFATGWSGTLSGGAQKTTYLGQSVVNLGGAALFSTAPQVSALANIMYFGGVAAIGYYEIPISHIIDIGSAQYCSVTLTYDSRIDAPLNKFSLVQKVSELSSIAGNYNPYGSVTPQIAVAGNDGIFGPWQNFIPGQYYGRKFKARMVFESSDVNVSAFLLGFTFSVDAPDVTDQGNSVSVPASGTSLLFNKVFHAIPNVQITVLNAQQGDTVVLTANNNLTGFTIQVINAGVGVSRIINWFAKGY